MNSLFTANPDYVKYESLLLSLHELFMANQEESVQAEELYSVMEECEPHISQPEVQRLGGLSADLYMIQGKEIFEETDLTAEQIKERYAEASQREDWEAALTLLRTGEIVTSPPELAALRARLYALLGHTEASLRFPTLCGKVCRAERYCGVHLPENAREEAKAARGCRGFNRVTTFICAL